MSLAVAAASEGALPSRKREKSNLCVFPKVQRLFSCQKGMNCSQSGSVKGGFHQIVQTGLHASEAFSSVLVNECADVMSASATSAVLV